MSSQVRPAASQSTVARAIAAQSKNGGQSARHFIGAVCLLVCAGLTAGCAEAPVASVQLAPDAINKESGRIGVVMSAIPKVTTNFPGASCLLCLATASMSNSALTKHTETLGAEDLPKVKDAVAALLRKKDPQVVALPDNIDVQKLRDYGGKEPGMARKDFRPLREKYQVDKLIVIDILSLGIVRPYSAYIAAGDPKAECHGRLYMVNLNDNSYELNVPLDIVKSADGAWSEPPKFPGLTNAYYQVLEMTRDSIVQPFAR